MWWGLKLRFLPHLLAPQVGKLDGVLAGRGFMWSQVVHGPAGRDMGNGSVPQLGGCGGQGRDRCNGSGQRLGGCGGGRAESRVTQQISLLRITRVGPMVRTAASLGQWLMRKIGFRVWLALI